MGDAGMTICLAIGVSAAVSLAVIPLASSRLFRDGYERYDKLLKFAVLGLVFALAGWKFNSVGTDAFIAWGSTTGSRILAQTLGMSATTAGVLVTIALLLIGAAWYFRRHGMRSSYVRLVNWTLEHRAVTLGVTFGFFGLGIWLITQLEQQGMSWTPERSVSVTVEVERSYSLAETDSLFARVEQLLLEQDQVAQEVSV